MNTTTPTTTQNAPKERGVLGHNHLDFLLSSLLHALPWVVKLKVTSGIFYARVAAEQVRRELLIKGELGPFSDKVVNAKLVAFSQNGLPVVVDDSAYAPCIALNA